MRNTYEANARIYGRLAEEVTFSLERALRQEGIKFHSVTSRVKTITSLEDKAKRLEIADPLSDLGDLVGVRVVVLFQSDLPRVEKLLNDLFEVEYCDNKLTNSDPDSFGYFSVHYSATLRSDHRGPRYDELQGIKFEIQTRTIVMDAWASVSHHLDYKGTTSVPSELRRDFYALSGLFYVADQHFEIFASQSASSQENAEEQIRSPDADPEANLDTVAALLADIFPDRPEAPRDGISEFVEEIAPFGYTKIRKLESAFTNAKSAVAEYEQKNSPHGIPEQYFNQVGAARHAIAFTDQSYAKWKYPGHAHLPDLA